MFKFVLFVLLISSNIFAKDVSITVLAKKSDVTAEMSADKLLTLNGFRQVVTTELADLNLDSELFWNKLSHPDTEENTILAALFENVILLQDPATDPLKLSGNFKASINLEKLKTLYTETIRDLAAMKAKTFYILANIGILPSMSWEDLGVSKADSFVTAILESWKKLIEKNAKDFEKVVLLEKDFSEKPAYMNSKSVLLKWTSTYKKTATNADAHTGSFELTAHYVLQNAKSGSILASFDFPIQKRDFDIQNTKKLSSSLASLVYNLLYSQNSKLISTLETESKSVEQAEIEIKITSKSSLTEVYQINSLLQEKFQDLKLSSQVKSYSSEGSILAIRVEGNLDSFLNRLGLNAGKIPLNEQKILIFNSQDKAFAILPKESNN